MVLSAACFHRDADHRYRNCNQNCHHPLPVLHEKLQISAGILCNHTCFCSLFLSAPVNAPFRTISFSRPAFPERSITVSIPEEASSSDLTAATTSAIQQAIDGISAQGGGTVIIPEGDWTTGRICLKSNVNLHLSKGCILNFSGRIKDYLPAVYTRDEGVNLYSLGACIYADGQTNIAVTGTGTIKGPSTDCEIYKRNSETVYKIEDLTTGPEAERIFEGRDGEPVFLPKTISPIRSRKVFIEGVTLEDGLFWNIVPILRRCHHPRRDGPQFRARTHRWHRHRLQPRCSHRILLA